MNKRRKEYAMGKYYDKEAIYDALSGEQVAEMLGIETRYMRGRAECLCPARDHDDRNLGNCVLTPKGCHCFACNRTFSLIDMVREERNLSGGREGYAEALEILAGFAGISPVDGSDGRPYEKPVKIPYSDEFLELLGLLPRGSSVEPVLNAQTDRPEKVGKDGKKVLKKATRDADGSYLVVGKPEKFSLLSLYKDDRETFFWMVGNKMDETLAQVSKALSTLKRDVVPPVHSAGVRKALLEMRKTLLLERQKLAERVA